MDKRLQASISASDFYSAHQLLLSHSQRLERAGKVKESTLFLMSGIMSLSNAHAPPATLFDVISKYVMLIPTIEDTSSPLEQDILNVLNVILECSNVPDNLQSYWRDYSSFACQHADPKKVFGILLKKNIRPIEVLELSISTVPDQSTIYSLFGPYISTNDFLCAAWTLLSLKCFGSVCHLKDSFVKSKELGELSKKVREVALYQENSCEAKAANLVTLLVELLRRANPGRDLYVQLQLRYMDILASEDVKKGWNSIRDTFWPQRQSGQVNPLASILQSMMMNNQ